ncbi:small subunit ribosomal protein S8e [Nematocida parisii]|uniref:40S ribosomal protein S8 n=1 Tax=Nematocida parisii (strain ERTm3) TaxID=935791 RepID=I3EKH3_NEMP3|nr:ribosomal protein S8E [Nematocida parisii ERTm1]EIJ89720.1 ribosomal protein S8E [Nematocida parisii ERTm3]KAI5129714.1 small subunit ribosomal protein S8e [Nematocida parisii]KAI5166790.1 small subunit ribosomal protein S8e [Nematocida sp. AWRm79]KAI5183785.1 small subunit ribosomal protein S8e [Nematocida sp. AWRm78]OAG33718.1 small subunit ribosomal protein S8e [Nematocida sp. ERTm5]|eukprot:XP_013058573.1 ribosomal protein S8E [Nematocida parisii ERTm1]
MGLTRNGEHKRKNTGGKKSVRISRKKHAIARQPASTKVGITKVKQLRVRGGRYKMRALRLASGSFTLKTHNTTMKCAINQVIYHGSNNELVRTNTLTKGCVVKLDPTGYTPVIEKILEAEKDILDIDPVFVDEFKQGNLYGVITSRPGQSGSADGHILQSEELSFYLSRVKSNKQRK